MVRKGLLNRKTIYVCEACGFGYGEKTRAQNCEDFCTAHHSCSLEITKHAIKK